VRELKTFVTLMFIENLLFTTQNPLLLILQELIMVLKCSIKTFKLNIDMFSDVNPLWYGTQAPDSLLLPLRTATRPLTTMKAAQAAPAVEAAQGAEAACTAIAVPATTPAASRMSQMAS